MHTPPFSQQAFQHIDSEIPARLIQLARDAGVPHCSVLTSSGSNPNSWLLYFKTKGQVKGDHSCVGTRSLIQLVCLSTLSIYLSVYLSI